MFSALKSGLSVLMSSLTCAAFASADTGARDACSLLSVAEVSSIIGAKVEPGDRRDSGQTTEGAYSSTCVWKVSGAVTAPAKPDAPFGGASFAMLNTMSWPEGSGDAKKYLEDFRDAAKSELIDMTPVPVAVGDEALWWGDGVAARKGDVSFGVSVHFVGRRSDERSMEEMLAQKIAPKLGAH